MLHVFYAGQVWNDRDVPWHYPWVMTAVTLPLGFLILGLIGLGSQLFRRNAGASDSDGSDRLPNDEAGLLAGTMGFVLLVFSWPGTPVYDGVRLFLMVFPLWAIWVGIGARSTVKGTVPFSLTRKLGQSPRRLVARPYWGQRPRLSAGVVAAIVVCQGMGLLVYSPCHLSYYNALVGGLAGAERLGFETTYWGDTVRESMLAEAARRSAGRPVLFAPNLASFQAPAIQITSPALCETQTALIGWNPARPETARVCRYAIVYRRRADLEGVEPLLREGGVVMEYAMQGVWLARLIALPAPLDAPDGAVKMNSLR